MMYVLVALIGLCIGSFFNVVLARFHREDGIIGGRSHCPSCKAQLPWYDLFPVFSFLALGGTCRFCGRPISFRYPAVEIITAAAATFFFYQYGAAADLQAALYGVLLLGFLLLFFFDAFYFILPDSIIVPMAAVSGVFVGIYQRQLLQSSLISGFLLGGVFAILYIVSRGRWVGFGDVKLLFLIGFAFGYPFGFLIAVSSIWIAALTGIILVVLRKATGKTALPFGAFLAAMAIVFILYAHELQNIRWIF